MSARQLSPKSLRAIQRATGLNVVAGWSDGSQVFDFVTSKHRHGWWNRRTQRRGFFDQPLHYPECTTLFPNGELMSDSEKRHISDGQLADWLGFHPADTERKRTGHEIVRTLCWVLATELNELLPESPEKTLALRAVQEVGLKANTCLAIGLGPATPAQVVSWQTECEVVAERLLGLGSGEIPNPVVS